MMSLSNCLTYWLHCSSNINIGGKDPSKTCNCMYWHRSDISDWLNWLNLFRCYQKVLIHDPARWQSVFDESFLSLLLTVVVLLVWSIRIIEIINKSCYKLYNLGSWILIISYIPSIMISQPLYLYNGNPYTWKDSLYIEMGPWLSMGMAPIK